MPNPPAPLPPHLRGVAFRIAQAPAIPRSRLRASDLHSPFHGVRAPAGSDALSALTALATGPGASFVSHASAARIHDLRRPRRFDRAIAELGVAGTARPPRRVGVRGRRLPADARVVLVDGVRALHPIDT